MDYYSILQVARSADAAQIKAAYKRLAKLYHPDHNPGNIIAEEKFKQINEAYHVLTDPLKKSRYDETFQSYKIPQKEQRTEVQRRRYYKMRHAMQSVYRIDREYFRIQALTFLVFIVIAGFCLTLFHTATYLWNNDRNNDFSAQTQAIGQAKAMFFQGNFERAITYLDTLQKRNPGALQLSFTRDSLLDEIRRKAEQDFDAHQYANAVVNYRILEKKESPPSQKTLQGIAFCQYYLGNYREAVVAMKQLHHQNPNDLNLIYNIGIINLDYLENAQEAILYFNLGEKKFKENLSALYGDNFASRFSDNDLPDVYYELFIGQARTSLQLNNNAMAQGACDWAMKLRPTRGEPYALRAICNLREGKRHLACNDLTESQQRLYPGADSLIQLHCR
ncbi:DnaJ domain-containing protein [Pseudochryseolinea flava]|uniref:J domain-containing protein n=1 Tax=Pseudochryseolinea flava TaxID=2059302 RepID=A0A364XZK1_9BACT|nr:DnaJ domain-containing protein [Pseudochryseolinea flava]RAV99213.1 hypothetical protein DQQ10_20145 [Pseudochryseolinea flava]